MIDSGVQFVVAAFEGEEAAEEALTILRSAQKDKKFEIEAALAVTKDQQGGVQYKDVGLTPAKGALGGVLLGGVVGLLTGGAGLVLGALGGLVGSLVGRKKRDSRLPNEQINQVLAAIPMGSSALLIVVGNQHLEKLEGTLDGLDADVLVAAIPEEFAQQLEQYHEEAYQALDSHLRES